MISSETVKHLLRIKEHIWRQINSVSSPQVVNHFQTSSQFMTFANFYSELVEFGLKFTTQSNKIISSIQKEILTVDYDLIKQTIDVDFQGNVCFGLSLSVEIPATHTNETKAVKLEKQIASITAQKQAFDRIIETFCKTLPPIHRLNLFFKHKQGMPLNTTPPVAQTMNMASC